MVDYRHGSPGRLQDRLLVTTTSLKRLVLENGCCLVNWFNEKENDEVHEREIEPNSHWVLMCINEQNSDPRFCLFFICS